MKKRVKEIQLPMRFIPGKMKYEPVLPVRKGSPKISVNWWIITSIIALLILAFYVFIIKGVRP